MTTSTITAHGLMGILGREAAPRELECLLAIASGQTSKEAARELGIAANTIDKRLLSLTTKLGVTRRAALVAEAFKRGLIMFASGMPPTPQHHQDQESTNGVFIA